MSELKATPGPWRAEHDKVFRGRLVVALANAGESLGIGEMVERRTANARLIAAAPSMYEELVYHLEMIRLMPSGETSDDFKRIDALLKKARGQS